MFGRDASLRPKPPRSDHQARLVSLVICGKGLGGKEVFWSCPALGEGKVGPPVCDSQSEKQKVCPFCPPSSPNATPIKAWGGGGTKCATVGGGTGILFKTRSREIIQVNSLCSAAKYLGNNGGGYMPDGVRAPPEAFCLLSSPGGAR